MIRSSESRALWHGCESCFGTGWFLPNDQFPGNHLFDRSTFKRPRMSVGSLERKTVEMNSKLGWGKPLQAVCQREESRARRDLPLVAIEFQFRKGLVPYMHGKKTWV
jgi:hypothetical protein